MGEINVVPYIDVMLVLLVIFMVTAPMLSQGVQVDLPQAEAKTVSSKEMAPLVVTVDAAGNYHLEHGIASPEVMDGVRLAARVAAVLQTVPQTPVYVKGDREAVYGQVVGAMALLQQAGVESVGLLTESPEN